MISAFKQNSPSPSKVVSPSTQSASLIKSFYLAAARLDRFGCASTQPHASEEAAKIFAGGIRE